MSSFQLHCNFIGSENQFTTFCHSPHDFQDLLKGGLETSWVILRNTGWSQNGDVSNGNWIENIQMALSSLALKFFFSPKLHSSKVWPESLPHRFRWSCQFPSPIFCLTLLHCEDDISGIPHAKLFPCNLWGTYVHFVYICQCKSLRSHSVGNWLLVSTTWTSKHFAVRKGHRGTRTSRCVCWKFRIINLGSTS